jgi:hypothetical protein
VPTYTPDEFAALLADAPVHAVREVAKVVQKGSLNVKNDARRNVQASAPIHNAHAYTAIGYDVEASGATVAGEIGYDKDIRAGRLGNLLEFGGGGDHSPPHHDLRRALEAEEPRFVQSIADAGEQALK